MQGSGTSYDVIIIGGGPAGITAAIYLARFRRRCIVLHAGDSRAAHIPLARNVPGFLEGISGRDLLARLTSQAEAYGAEIRQAQVHRVLHVKDGFVAQCTDGAQVMGSTVLLATGSIDLVPDIYGLPDAVGRGVVRICPVCDGYETAGRTVAVVGDPDRSLNEARFLLNFEADVAILGDQFSEQIHAEARRSGITVHEGVADVEMHADGIRVKRADGRVLAFDHLYPAYGCEPRSELGAPLGVDLLGSGHIETDEHQRTSVPGIWAAGDVVHSLSQIAVAFGQAAVAATSIHNSLLDQEH